MQLTSVTCSCWFESFWDPSPLKPQAGKASPVRGILRCFWDADRRATKRESKSLSAQEAPYIHIFMEVSHKPMIRMVFWGLKQ